MARFQIAGHVVEIEAVTVERALTSVHPDPVRDHYVIIGARRFPPKQVLSLVTGIDRADFTTHQARRILKRLGFVAARRAPRRTEPDGEDRSAGPHGGRQAAALEPYIGKWVALGEPDEVLVAADTPHEVVAWLARNEMKATGMFRVPRAISEAEGLAPL
jgi:hypothetical protein